MLPPPISTIKVRARVHSVCRPARSDLDFSQRFLPFRFDFPSPLFFSLFFSALLFLPFFLSFQRSLEAFLLPFLPFFQLFHAFLYFSFAKDLSAPVVTRVLTDWLGGT